MLIGEFEGPRRRPYAMVVNKSLSESACLDLRFKRPGGIHVVNAYTSQIEPWEGEHCWLAPGQGRLLGVGR
jgi:hypothetical protein